MMSPEFLIIRYANGSAGKFFATLLMSSKSVAHFDYTVEHNKTAESLISYAHKHFIRNVDDWLKFEPKHTEAWNLHFISSNYTRGEDLSSDEFLSLAKADATEHFWNCVNRQLLIPFVWHKQSIPDFFKSAKFITIIIDDDSVKWYHRARWYKQYGIKESAIHLKEHDPDYNLIMKTYYDKFHNEYLLNQHPYSFIKENIINSKTKKLFRSKEKFINQPIEQEFINLSDILDINKCIAQLNRVCEKFNLSPIPEQIIIDSHSHWISCHTFKYAKNS